MNRSIALPLALSLACLVAACGGGQGGKVASASGSQQANPAGEIDAIVQLLNDGEHGQAKKRISKALKKDPNNPALMLLRDSVTRKPEEFFGPESFRYTVRAGDTMAALSQRFLGNRLKFYQLARYNGIEQPSSLRAGQVINIPGRAPVERPPVVERKPAPAPTAPRPKAAVAAPAPARPAANPAAAGQARSAGLAALNAGRPAQAVSLLSRAASLDPGNAAIARDLARARRIAATVGAK